MQSVDQAILVHATVDERAEWGDVGDHTVAVHAGLEM